MSNWSNDYLIRNPEKVSKLFERGKNFLRFKNNKDYITEFVGFPCHYFDNGIWKPIDTSLVSMGAEYGCAGLRTRLKLNGEIKILDTSMAFGLHSQRTERIGTLNIKNFKFSAVSNIPDGIVVGDSIVRQIGYFEHRLKVTEIGMKETLAITQPFGVNISDLACIETNFGTIQLWIDGWLDTAFTRANNVFHVPFGKDTNDNIIPLRRYAKYSEGRQYLYTGIMASEFQKYTFPIIIDPDFTESTNDGYVRGANGSNDYSAARSTSDQYISAGENIKIGQSYNLNTYTSTASYYIWRSFLKFDTSSIPDGNTVTQVNLKLSVPLAGDGSGTDFDVQIVKQDWSGQDQLSDVNREAAFDNCLSGTADDSIWKNTVSIDISQPPYTYTGTSGNLSTAWVSKTGNTYYSLRSSRDYNNSPPTGNEFIIMASQEHETEALRPVLTVAHSESNSYIKTVLGLAKASVKTVDGLGIASIKTWEGLS